MIKKFLLALGAVSFTFFLSACAITDVNHYKDVKPQLDLEKFFLGTTDAWGMFQQRNGAVIKRFHVVIDTKKIGEELVLDERFVYDDGSKQQRIWHLRKNADGRWIGKADDVKGDALGEVAGNAFKWQYTLLLPVDGSIYEMAMDDWMYLIDENTMVNRAKMSKFGFEVGEVTLFFRRRG
ncbi:DUF3833 domain-containing protein [Undibacterium amnicola]|uniref:DUF3833 domain-containing protein n=1 Tax=Undibacterium amnicola TaxID=1834038 RepID=A0ABR6XLY7_9BURK|nr:DUF3833 domain-containing protein [Undibacterium amnicola]MBC3830535.1 DUF3833 domain-containing protein [Undibacterium amnicola]